MLFYSIFLSVPAVFPDLLTEVAQVLKRGGGGRGMGLAGVGGLDLSLPLSQHIVLSGEGGELPGLGKALLGCLREEEVDVPNQPTPLPIPSTMLAFMGASVYASAQVILTIHSVVLCD